MRPAYLFHRSCLYGETALLEPGEEGSLRSVAAYRRVLPVDDLEERVEMVGAYLIGVTFGRYVLGGGPLAELSAEHLVAPLTRSLRGILLG